MLLLDEPFGALGAFTREEPWCILRDLWTERRLSISEYIFPAPLVIA
jgi:NitT/TauT family transport system ATP-binding protein